MAKMTAAQLNQALKAVRALDVTPEQLMAWSHIQDAIEYAETSDEIVEW